MVEQIEKNNKKSTSFRKGLGQTVSAPLGIALIIIALLISQGFSFFQYREIIKVLTDIRSGASSGEVQ